MQGSRLWQTSLFTTTALVAFAANSILCRWALKEESIDPLSFTAIRLLSGAAVLLLILQFSARKKKSSSRGSWISGTMLFLYAWAFSMSYVSLDTATGALILFGAVQITMVVHAIFKGDKLQLAEWTGLFLAVGGFVYLLLSAPKA